MGRRVRRDVHAVAPLAHNFLVFRRHLYGDAARDSAAPVGAVLGDAILFGASSTSPTTCRPARPSFASGYGKSLRIGKLWNGVSMNTGTL